MTRKQNYKKLLCVLLSLLLLVVTLIAGGCTASDEQNADIDNNNEVAASDEPVTDNAEDSPNSVITIRESNGVSLASAVIPREAYVENDISDQADSAYTLTLEVTPEGAIGEFDWTVSGNEDNGITLKPQNMSASFICNGAFGIQKVITATLRDNPEISTSCTVDYYKRLESVSLNAPTTIKLSNISTEYSVQLVSEFSEGTILDITVTITSGYIRNLITDETVTLDNNAEIKATDNVSIDKLTGKFSLVMSPSVQSSFFKIIKGSVMFYYSQANKSYYNSCISAWKKNSDRDHYEIRVYWLATRNGERLKAGSSSMTGQFDVSDLKAV